MGGSVKGFCKGAEVEKADALWGAVGGSRRRARRRVSGRYMKGFTGRIRGGNLGIYIPTTRYNNGIFGACPAVLTCPQRSCAAASLEGVTTTYPPANRG